MKLEFSEIYEKACIANNYEGWELDEEFCRAENGNYIIALKPIHNYSESHNKDGMTVDIILDSELNEINVRVER